MLENIGYRIMKSAHDRLAQGPFTELSYLRAYTYGLVRTVFELRDEEFSHIIGNAASDLRADLRLKNFTFPKHFGERICRAMVGSSFRLMHHMREDPNFELKDRNTSVLEIFKDIGLVKFCWVGPQNISSSFNLDKVLDYSLDVFGEIDDTKLRRHAAEFLADGLLKASWPLPNFTLVDSTEDRAMYMRDKK